MYDDSFYSMLYFRSQNALKLTYVHVQFQNFFSRIPVLARRGGRKPLLRQNPGYGLAASALDVSQSIYLDDYITELCMRAPSLL